MHGWYSGRCSQLQEAKKLRPFISQVSVCQILSQGRIKQYGGDNLHTDTSIDV